ncbi:hypothetical protein Aduo_001902 [Ancylostoma duodenale]
MQITFANITFHEAATPLPESSTASNLLQYSYRRFTDDSDERGDEATCRRRRRIRLSMKRKLSDADNFIWQVEENPPADETQIGEHRGPCAIDYDS